MFEKDYSTILTDEEREEIFSHPYANTYPLTNEQCQFLDDEGYLVIKKLYDVDVCDKLVDEIYDAGKRLFNLDRGDPNTWSVIPSYGMLNLWHLPTMYQMRQSEALYSIFCQLLRTNQLVVSLDRVSAKNPCTKPLWINGEVNPNENLQLHTDQNYWYSDPRYAQFQCGVCLEDCYEDCGGFFCLPRAHKSERIEKYKSDCESGKFGKFSMPPPKKVFLNYFDKEALLKEKITIPLEKGDIVIWNNGLPHAGGINRNPDLWRLQAFIRFLALDGPSLSESIRISNRDYRNIVNHSVTQGTSPAWFPTGNGVPKNLNKDIEKETYQFPPLTTLGKKVLGIVKWEKKTE